jgi:uncharacterized membrane protein
MPRHLIDNDRGVGMGPVEYVIIGFPGNQFTGEIAPELARLIERDVVRIIDLVFIGKDDAGNVVVIEVDEDAGLSAFAMLDGEIGGVIGDEDVQHAAEAIEPGSSALLIVWEDTWAAPLVQAIRNSGGVLLEGSRIPAELMDDAEALLASGG